MWYVRGGDGAVAPAPDAPDAVGAPATAAPLLGSSAGGGWDSTRQRTSIVFPSPISSAITPPRMPNASGPSSSRVTAQRTLSRWNGSSWQAKPASLSWGSVDGSPGKDAIVVQR